MRSLPGSGRQRHPRPGRLGDGVCHSASCNLELMQRVTGMEDGLPRIGAVTHAVLRAYLVLQLVDALDPRGDAPSSVIETIDLHAPHAPTDRDGAVVGSSWPLHLTLNTAPALCEGARDPRAAAACRWSSPPP